MEAAGFSEVFEPLTRRPLVVTAVSVSYRTVFFWSFHKIAGFLLRAIGKHLGEFVCMRGSVHLGRFVKTDHVRRCSCVQHGWSRAVGSVCVTQTCWQNGHVIWNRKVLTVFCVACQ